VKRFFIAFPQGVETEENLGSACGDFAHASGRRLVAAIEEEERFLVAALLGMTARVWQVLDATVASSPGSAP
jgi:hypothetical protein